MYTHSDKNFVRSTAASPAPSRQSINISESVNWISKDVGVCQDESTGKVYYQSNSLDVFMSFQGQMPHSVKICEF